MAKKNIYIKLKNSNCEKKNSEILILPNSETQIMAKLNNSNSDKTQHSN